MAHSSSVHRPSVQSTDRRQSRPAGDLAGPQTGHAVVRGPEAGATRGGAKGGCCGALVCQRRAGRQGMAVSLHALGGHAGHIEHAGGQRLACIGPMRPPDRGWASASQATSPATRSSTPSQPPSSDQCRLGERFRIRPTVLCRVQSGLAPQTGIEWMADKYSAPLASAKISSVSVTAACRTRPTPMPAAQSWRCRTAMIPTPTISNTISTAL